MGPTTENGDVFLVTYDSLYLGQQIITTLAYRVTESFSGTYDLTTTYEALRDKLDSLGGVSTCYADMFTEQVSSIKLHIQKVYPTRWVKDTDFAAPPQGTRAVANPNTPASAAGVITLRSIAAEATGRGNKHILATDPEDVASGEISATFSGLMQQWGDVVVVPLDLAAPAAGMVMAPIIYHRANPIASFQVDWAAVQPHSRIMRRRTVGQGS